MAIALLHFANLRLGAGFTSFGIRGRDQRAQLLVTLADLAHLAVTESVEAVLISGDLFDCEVPAPATVAAVQSFFTRLRENNIAAVVLPGSRDPLSVFDQRRQPDNIDVCPGAAIVSAASPVVQLQNTALDVYYVDVPAAAGTVSIKGMLEPGAKRIRVGLGSAPFVDTPNLGEIAAVASGFGMHYLGIGGYTTFSTAASGALHVCSPGVPEPLTWGQEEGTVALVRIDDTGAVHIERRKTGSRSFARREIEVNADSAGTIGASIRGLGNDDLGLEVILSGICPAEVLIDPGSLEGQLADGFFHLRVIDHTGLVIDTSGVGSLPQGTVLGNFATVMDGRIQAAENEDDAALEREAYRIGLGLLQGGESLR